MAEYEAMIRRADKTSRTIRFPGPYQAAKASVYEQLADGETLLWIRET